MEKNCQQDDNMATGKSKKQQHKLITWTLPRVEGFRNMHRHMVNMKMSMMMSMVLSIMMSMVSKHKNEQTITMEME